METASSWGPLPTPVCVAAVALAVGLIINGQCMSATLVLLSLLVIWELGPPFGGKKRSGRQAQRPAVALQRAGADEEELEDDGPLRWSFMPSVGVHRANIRPYKAENDLARLKILVLHRPTHDPAREASGDYPYSSHFMGRRRIWEVRIQIRFKKLPEGPIYFGLETRYIAGHTMSSGVKRIKNMLLGAVRGVIGKEFHHSPGDDPETTKGEAEPPTFAMPMWAIDQFHVADDGQEPDITGDLTGLGFKRTDGVKPYIGAMQDMQNNLDCEKVYTFCFWGISQFVDGHNWEFTGKLLRMDANKLCGAPPAYVVAYQLAKSEDPRHLVSRKRYYFKVALWSALKPPEAEFMRSILGAHKLDDDRPGRSSWTTTGRRQAEPTSCWERRGGWWSFFCDCAGQRPGR